MATTAIVQQPDLFADPTLRPPTGQRSSASGSSTRPRRCSATPRLLRPVEAMRVDDTYGHLTASDAHGWRDEIGGHGFGRRRVPGSEVCRLITITADLRCEHWDEECCRIGDRSTEARLHCAWEGEIRDDYNGAVEDAHDARPGWRDLPIVQRTRAGHQRSARRPPPTGGSRRSTLTPPAGPRPVARSARSAVTTAHVTSRTTPASAATTCAGRSNRSRSGERHRGLPRLRLHRHLRHPGAGRSPPSPSLLRAATAPDRARAGPRRPGQVRTQAQLPAPPREAPPRHPCCLRARPVPLPQVHGRQRGRQQRYAP